MDHGKRDFRIVAALIGALFGALLYLTVPALVHAGAVPQYAIGVNGVWFKSETYPDDFELGGNGSLSLSPHISIVGAGYYGFEKSYLRGSLGARLTATDPNDPNFSIGLGIQQHLSSEESVKPQEMAVDASIGYRPWPAEQPRVLLIAAGFYGLKTETASVIAGVRYSLSK